MEKCRLQEQSTNKEFLLVPGYIGMINIKKEGRSLSGLLF